MSHIPTSRARLRTANWLARHGLPGVAPTALVTRRIEAQWRLRLGALLGGVALVVTLPLLAIHTDLRRNPLLLSVLVLTGGLMFTGAQLWLTRWVDGRVAATLPRRAARPVAHAWPAVLGRAMLTALATSAAGIVGAGALALAFGTRETRVVAVVMLIGSAVCAALAAGEVSHAVHRPTVAEDELSLAVDDLLRTINARRYASSPMPAAFSLAIVGVMVDEPRWLETVCGGLAMVGVAAMLVASALIHPRRGVEFQAVGSR